MKRLCNYLFLIFFISITFCEKAFGQTTCSSLTSPANGATGITTSGVRLTWNAPSTTTRFKEYQVSWGTTSSANHFQVRTSNRYYDLTSLSCNTTYYWKVEPIYYEGCFGLCWGEEIRCTTPSIASFTTVTGSPAGDPSVFGNGVWNVYCFSTDSYTNYQGFYTESNLSFNTASKWTVNNSPSSTSGYQGCAVPADYFSIIYKRTNFTPGLYRIDVPYHDDDCELWVNGTRYLNHSGYGDHDHDELYVGVLNSLSTVEFRLKDGSGESRGAVDITLLPALQGGSISGNQNMCPNGNPAAFTSSTAASGGCTKSYQWQSSTGGAYTDISAATGLTYDSPALTQTTMFRRKVTDNCGGTEYSNVLTVAVPENPTVFGNNQWNVYCYSGNNFNTYQGYYIETNLSFNSTSRWSLNGTPSSASGYIGCAVPVDNHSVSYKRSGFPPGNYQIDIADHDDEYFLLVNGVQVATHNGCCDSHNAVYIGTLNASSTVEFRWREGTGGSAGAVNFTLLPALQPGTISGSQTICPSGDPDAFTDDTSPSGGCTKTYQWQFSTGGAYADISGATGLTYDSPALTQTTMFRRRVTDNCGGTEYSNVITVTVPNLGNPSVFGNGQWNVYCYSGNNFNTYNGYYIETSLSFNSTNRWPAAGTPSSASDYVGCAVPVDNHSVIYKRTNFAPGYYQIDIANHDDEYFLFVNGTQVATHNGWGDSHNAVYLGPLNATSTVEFRWREGGGDSRGAVNITKSELTAGTIIGNQTICSGADPVAFSATAASNGCTLSGYQWQSSTNGTTFTDILNATSATFDPPVLTQTTHYRRIARDVCGASATSNTLTITVNSNRVVGVSITGPSTEICSGTSVTFTATPTNGGTNPQYQWRVNGNNVATGASFNSSSLQDNDVVTCVLTSNYSCISGSSTATSNSITMKVKPVGEWLGITNSWASAANWCGPIPSATTDVIIKAGVPNMPLVDGAGLCRNLTIEPGATLTLQNGQSLSISGTWVNNGTFNANEGTIIYSGTGTQTILALNYYNLRSIASGNRQFSTSGPVGIAGAFLPGPNNYLNAPTGVSFNGSVDQEIPAFTYNDLSTSGTGKKLLSGNIIVNGTLSSPLLDLNDRSLTANGTVTNATTFKGTIGSDLTMGSTSDLVGQLKFAPGFENLKNLTINKNSDITLGNPLTIHGVLTFPNNGHLLTNAQNILTLEANGSYTNESENSFVDGPMAKKMQNNVPFVFPIGKGNLWRRAGVEPEGKLATTYTAEYFNADPRNIGINPTLSSSLHHISELEYWDIHKDGPSNARVQLFWGMGSEVALNEIDHLSLRIAHFNSNTSQWENNEVELDISHTYNVGYLITTEYLSNFSPFTLASTTVRNPLPVDLKDFKVKQDGLNAVLTWHTMKEINNKGFEIQKSVGDPFNFERIGFVAGANFSNSRIDYSFVDEKFSTVPNYFRLKQLDNDGNVTYSKVVDLKLQTGKFNIYLSPNPTTDGVSVQWNDNVPGDIIYVNVFNSQGVIVGSFRSEKYSEIDAELSSIVKALSSGVYIIKINSGILNFTEKLIKL